MRLIDADKLKAKFDFIADKYGIGDKKYISIKDIKMIIDKTSTARRARRKTTKRSQGEWEEINERIGIGEDNIYTSFKCPFCGYIDLLNNNYCGNCGAEMQKGDVENDK